MEIWKDVVGYDGLYKVSTRGNIKSLKFAGGSLQKTLKLRKDKDGYFTVNLYKDGKVKNLKVHRLVAIAFIENNENLPQINHKNEIKHDNRIENLEWCTNRYNINYGSHTLKMSISNTGKKHTMEHIQKIRDGAINKKPVLMINANTFELLQEFPSASEAARQINGTATNISKVCREEKGTYKGFRWRYLK